MPPSQAGRENFQAVPPRIPTTEPIGPHNQDPHGAPGAKQGRPSAPTRSGRRRRGDTGTIVSRLDLLLPQSQLQNSVIKRARNVLVLYGRGQDQLFVANTIVAEAID